jgi:hypothetical protein
MENSIYLIISRSVLLGMRNVSDKTVEKITTYILIWITFFLYFFRLSDNVEKSSRAVEATGDNMAHLHFTVGIKVLYADTHTHTHTLRIYNMYCYSTVTMVAWTRLNVTLYVHCLPVSCPFFCGIQCRSSQNSATGLRLVLVPTCWLYCRHNVTGLSYDDRFLESGRRVSNFL